MTGLTPRQFGALLQTLEPAYARLAHERLARTGRRRAIGAGRKFSLSFEQRVTLLLLHAHLRPTQKLLAQLCHLTESTVSRELTRLRPLLDLIVQLAPAVRAPRSPRVGTMEELLERHPVLGLPEQVSPALPMPAAAFPAARAHAPAIGDFHPAPLAYHAVSAPRSPPLPW